MVKVKFNNKYEDKQLGRLVEADEVVEMTQERADELVETIRKQSSQKRFEDWKTFDYEVVDDSKQDLNSLKKEELYPLLDKAEIDYNKNEKKEELIAKLEAKDDEEAE